MSPQQRNLLLLSLNILALSIYLHIHANIRHTLIEQCSLLLIFIVCSLSKHYHLQLEAKTIPVLVLCSVFIEIDYVALLLAACACALAFNIAYEMLRQILINEQLDLALRHESALHIVLSLSVLLAELTHKTILIKGINEQILLLACTFPNLYLFLDCKPYSKSETLTQTQIHTNTLSTTLYVPYNAVYSISSQLPSNVAYPSFTELSLTCPTSIENKLVYYVTPLFEYRFSYSIGYIIGIYIEESNLFRLEKTVKYLLAALMLLVELETTGIIKHVFCCLRGMMIYHRRPTAHRLEYLFVLSLFVLRMLDASAIDVYMVAGYLCLALAMWTEQDGNVGIKGQLKAENEGAREIELQTMLGKTEIRRNELRERLLDEGERQEQAKYETESSLTNLRSK